MDGQEWHPSAAQEWRAADRGRRQPGCTDPSIGGRAQASTEGYGLIARMGAGEIVGEVSLVDSAPASATITARGDSYALFLDKKILLERLEREDGFASRFYRALAIFLADRLRATRRPAADKPSDCPAI